MHTRGIHACKCTFQITPSDALDAPIDAKNILSSASDDGADDTANVGYRYQKTAGKAGWLIPTRLRTCLRVTRECEIPYVLIETAS